jgi:hypothetical protein
VSAALVLCLRLSLLFCLFPQLRKCCLMLSSMAAVDGGYYPLSLEKDAFYL